jgi:integrase/recombinase XerD
VTVLDQAVNDYLATRRSLGFKLEKVELHLRSFLRHLDATGQSVITVDAAVEWACTPADADPYWWSSKLATVRGFARWWSVFDPVTEIPGSDVLPESKMARRAEPYPFIAHAAIERTPEAMAAARWEALHRNATPEVVCSP